MIVSSSRTTGSLTISHSKFIKQSLSILVIYMAYQRLQIIYIYIYIYIYIKLKINVKNVQNGHFVFFSFICLVAFKYFR